MCAGRACPSWGIGMVARPPANWVGWRVSWRGSNSELK